ncbi:hypothetical protein HY571_02140 [Candidatus Micrarchaeota archaeon]|nr:hypothetical protein [Candidatus Micrarchaeota archaeon]
MKAIIEVAFKSEKEAKQAMSILKASKTDEPTRASVSVKTKGEKLVVTVTAKDYAALRALTTTLLRDLRVVIDGFEIIGG